MPPSLNRIAYYRDRCTPPLTQLTLAEALGVHVNTIRHWEKRGAPAPADLLRLCELFAERGAIGDYGTAATFWEVSGRARFPPMPELERLFDRGEQFAPQALPANARMPLHRNPLFVGRAAELGALATMVETCGLAIISGIGGIGKTQLACEFVHRYGQLFPGGLFWLNFADANAVGAEVASCGDVGRMELRPDFGQRPLAEQVRLVQAAWQAPIARLLVFDNCEDERLLADWRPTIGGCRVLVTSRRSRWDASLGAGLLQLQTLRRAESIALLRRRDPSLAGETAQLDAVADALGDLPLALHLAGSFLERYRESCSLADYLRQLRASAELLAHPSFAGSGFSPTRHEQHLGRTFTVSYEQLDARRPADALALRLLARAAFFGPGEPIARELLLASCGSSDPFVAADALARLSELGLLEPAASGALRLHRLLAAFARAASADLGASDDVARTICDYAGGLIDTGTTEPMRAILGHTRFVVETQLRRLEPAGRDPQQNCPCGAMPERARDARRRAAKICSVLGMLLVRLAAYDEAHPHIQRAVALSREAGDAAATTESLVQLAILHQYRHQFDDAQRCYEEALALARAALPADDPLLASCAAHLGYALSLRGAFDQAGRLLEQGLAVAERAYGRQHPEIATYLDLLGYHLVLFGDLARARALIERALLIREAGLGRRGLLVVQTLNNLAEALQAAGDLRAARAYHQRALAGRIELFGERHHGVAESYRNLGMLALAEGNASAAQHLIAQAVTLCEQTVGVAHRDTALAYAALAELELALGRREAALDRYRQALVILGSFYLPGSPPLLRLHARVADLAGALERGQRCYDLGQALQIKELTYSDTALAAPWPAADPQQGR